jgi:hypothetical protein
VKIWWLTNDETINLRSKNDWTIDLQPHTVTEVTHDDDDTVVVSDDETYETHYGLRDPMSNLLIKSYFHAWTMKGGHTRFVTYTEHTTKCKNTTIPTLSTVGNVNKISIILFLTFIPIC